MLMWSGAGRSLLHGCTACPLAGALHGLPLLQPYMRMLWGELAHTTYYIAGHVAALAPCILVGPMWFAVL